MMLVHHRLPPTLPIAHRLPPTLPIAQELQVQCELIAKRSSARAAASDECRRVAKELAKRRPSLLPHRQPPSLPPRPTTRAARRPYSAPLLLGQMSAAGGRSAWGYFKCTRSLHPETGDVLLRMQPPEDEQQGWPSIAIARPCTRDVLQHGPFAFKLSPSSEVLAHLIVTRLRKALAKVSASCILDKPCSHRPRLCFCRGASVGAAVSICQRLRAGTSLAASLLSASPPTRESKT